MKDGNQASERDLFEAFVEMLRNAHSGAADGMTPVAAIFVPAQRGDEPGEFILGPAERAAVLWPSSIPMLAREGILASVTLSYFEKKRESLVLSPKGDDSPKG